jgi:hypothetical protein
MIHGDGLPVSQYHGMKNRLSGLGFAGTKHPGVSNELILNARLATQRKGPVRGMSTCAAKPESAQDGSSARREKGAGASTQSTRKLASLPSCSKGNYACKNCTHPLIPQSPKGPLLPCDGSIYFCRFATASTTMPVCPRVSLQNYACTHGGGSCVGYLRRRRLNHAF